MMKNLKSLKTRKSHLINNGGKLVAIAFIIAIALFPQHANAQIEVLTGEVANFESNARSMGQNVMLIIKILAGLGMAIGAIAFVFKGNSQNDLTKHAGTIFVGAAMFFAVITLAENIIG